MPKNWSCFEAVERVGDVLIIYKVERGGRLGC